LADYFITSNYRRNDNLTDFNIVFQIPKLLNSKFIIGPCKDYFIMLKYGNLSVCIPYINCKIHETNML